MTSHPVHIGGLRFPSATAMSSHETRGALFSGAAEPEKRKRHNNELFEKNTQMHMLLYILITKYCHCQFIHLKK